MSIDRAPPSVAERFHLVEEHVRCENAHDLSGIMATFGEGAHYDDTPWGERHRGRDGVEAYYRDLLTALPDLAIEVVNRAANQENVILEVVINGTHAGSWRGLPATGRRVRFPLCAVYQFDQAGKLAGEKIYYDRATVLRQIGLYHEPDTASGLVVTLLSHPVTILRALARKLFRGVRRRRP